MKKSTISPGGKGRNRSLSRPASGGLIDFINSKYPKRIPIAAVTAVSKMFGKGRPLQKDDRLLRRLAGNSNEIPTAQFIELLANHEHHEKGKVLSDEGVKRVYDNYANQDGKLTFEYVMKMGESNGVNIDMYMAKKIVKKYGKKDYLNAEDCLKINKRRSSSRNNSRTPTKDKR